MAHLYLIRGIPGSGKTTLANKMLRCGMVDFVFEADQFMLDDNGEYSFNPIKLPNCHHACKDATLKALDDGFNVAVSNTFVREWEMLHYIRMGFDHTVLVCQGDYGSIHNVPRETVLRMKNAFEY